MLKALAYSLAKEHPDLNVIPAETGIQATVDF